MDACGVVPHYAKGVQSVLVLVGCWGKDNLVLIGAPCSDGLADGILEIVESGS